MPKNTMFSSLEQDPYTSTCVPTSRSCGSNAEHVDEAHRTYDNPGGTANGRRSTKRFLLFVRRSSKRNGSRITYLGGELPQPFRFLRCRVTARRDLHLGDIPVEGFRPGRESHGQLMQLLQRVRAGAVTRDPAHLPLFRSEERPAAHQDVPAEHRFTVLSYWHNSIDNAESKLVTRVGRKNGATEESLDFSVHPFRKKIALLWQTLAFPWTRLKSIKAAAAIGFLVLSPPPSPLPRPVPYRKFSARQSLLIRADQDANRSICAVQVNRLLKPGERGGRVGEGVGSRISDRDTVRDPSFANLLRF